MATSSNGGLTTTLSAAGLVILLLATLFGAQWFVIQQGLGNLMARLEEKSAGLDEQIKAVDSAIRRMVAGQQEALKLSDNILRSDLKGIHTQLNAQRHEFISVEQMGELSKRIDAYIATPYLPKSEFMTVEVERKILIEQLLSRLDRLESTRPTTGELQAVAGSNTTLVNRLDDRVRSLEDYVRSARPQGALAPVVNGLAK
jgi:hypothetical protein